MGNHRIPGEIEDGEIAEPVIAGPRPDAASIGALPHAAARRAGVEVVRRGPGGGLGDDRRKSADIRRAAFDPRAGIDRAHRGQLIARLAAAQRTALPLAATNAAAAAIAGVAVHLHASVSAEEPPRLGRAL